ncbi:serine/threonine protein kinase [Streptomyces sp. 5-8]|uniref:non-specific serine/threonine protein kinase n=1 Tax=Streptomyces musisoli TaxID=2802280 RepID=A0ABS1NZY2_9ACTN|nr:serine/threonine-protein kinase [Streptomyces musisoli]MBL1105678.1 serine/threonine protein kinase [Streptomyces musisoli]
MTEDGELPPDARLIGGRYRLAGRLGAGPTGTVWRARDEQGQGRPVAVKEPLLPGDPATDEESRRIAHRLHHEARAATRVRHPSAVTVHDVVTEAGVPWIVMELVAGESLREVLRRGPLPAAEAARIGLAVLGALCAAHAVGIVHRDVKPANVLLESGTGRVVLTDFGIGDGHTEDAPAGFVAPERAAGPGAGPASDLWSLGALLRAAVGDADPGSLGPLGPLLDRLNAEEPAARPGPHEVTAVLGDYLGLTPAPDTPTGTTQPGEPGAGAAGPEPQPDSDSVARPAAEPEPEPDALPEPEPEPEPKPESAARPVAGPLPVPGTRRRNPLGALGLLLAKKPGAD